MVKLPGQAAVPDLWRALAYRPDRRFPAADAARHAQYGLGLAKVSLGA
jgi:hypothetical protein